MDVEGEQHRRCGVMPLQKILETSDGRKGIYEMQTTISAGSTLRSPKNGAKSG
jgi:hypothetical protein